MSTLKHPTKPTMTLQTCKVQLLTSVLVVTKSVFDSGSICMASMLIP